MLSIKNGRLYRDLGSTCPVFEHKGLRTGSYKRILCVYVSVSRFACHVKFFCLDWIFRFWSLDFRWVPLWHFVIMIYIIMPLFQNAQVCQNGTRLNHAKQCSPKNLEIFPRLLWHLWIFNTLISGCFIVY